MVIIDWDDFIKNGLPDTLMERKKTSITIGVFDGVHLGHQALIRHIVSHNDKIPAAVTFKNPYHKKGKPVCHIQTFEEKAKALESLGVKILVVVEFTDTFRKMKGKDFMKVLLKRGNIGFFAIGSSFRCGCGLDTDAQAIKQFFEKQNIPVEIVPEVLHDCLPVSSSRIRKAIADGDLLSAGKMLGRTIEQ